MNICLPCQVGGKEYKGYGDTPFSETASKDDVLDKLLIKNDYKHAYERAGEELKKNGKTMKYILYKSQSKSFVPEPYQYAVSFKTFINTKIPKCDYAK